MAIDIIARGLASSLVGSDGKIAAEKMPTLGAVPDGTNFYPVGQLNDPSLVAGKTAEEILLMMLYGIVSPTLTEPSLSIALSDENEMLIIGRPSALKGALTFSRGKIDPAFTTSGYRAGAPTGYLIGDQIIESTSTSYDFELMLTPTETTIQIPYAVSYNAGEQPVNSIGQPVGAPLSAGSISSTIEVKAAYPLYNGEGEKHEFTWFKDEDGSGYMSIFAMETTDNKQTFMVSSKMNVIGIKAFNTMTQSWDWLGGTPAVSLTHFDATVVPGDTLGENTDYIVYTHNRQRVGERELRIYVQ